jgi:hypothetical protein
MNEITSKFWYPKIVENIDCVIDAIDYYRRLHATGERNTKMKGIIHKLLEEQPQLMQDYEDALVDCSMIHKWLEEQIKFLKARKRIEFMTDANLKAAYGDLKKTDIENFVTADEAVQSHVQLMLLVELWKNSLDSLVTRLNRRGIYLTMISKLRINGEHEAYIDTTHETDISHL